MNVGILTAGGLCPGLNTVIRSIVIKEITKNEHTNVYGYEQGFWGLNNNVKRKLCEADVSQLQDKAGTILHTSRERLNVGHSAYSISMLDKLYCIGGNGTLEAAKLIHDSFYKINVIGIAKTIDNDIHALESFGYQTAIEETTKCIHCAYIEATSMCCIVFIETMGRNSGFLAAQAAQASSGYVDYCIVPEIPFDPGAYFATIKETFEQQGHCVVVVSEGVDYTSLYQMLSLACKTKKIVPGYIVRSCKPNTSDIILATKMANSAVEKSYLKTNFVQGVDKDIPFDEFQVGEKLLSPKNLYDMGIGSV